MISLHIQWSAVKASGSFLDFTEGSEFKCLLLGGILRSHFILFSSVPLAICLSQNIGRSVFSILVENICIVVRWTYELCEQPYEKEWLSTWFMDAT